MAQIRRADDGKRQKVAKDILKSYRPSGGCPPLHTHSRGDKMAKSAWRREFATAIGHDDNRTTAWLSLRGGHCDMSRLIDLLYLFTFSGRASVDDDTHAHHLLKGKLKKLSSMHDKLDDELQRLRHDPRLSRAMIYVGPAIASQMKMLEQALLAARHAAHKWGSYKTYAKDWYLYCMAADARRATRHNSLGIIVTLIEGAKEAHGGPCTVRDEQLYRKRIQRFRKRLRRQAIFPAQPHLDEAQPHFDEEDIPF
jgi:hypothetical protein